MYYVVNPAGSGGGGLHIIISSKFNTTANTSVILRGVHAKHNLAVASGGGVYVGVGGNFDILGTTVVLEDVDIDDNVAGEWESKSPNWLVPRSE